MNKRSTRATLAALGFFCALSVVLALVAQHRFQMQPCPWCILQRMLFVLIALLLLLGAVAPWPTLRRALAALTVPLAAGGVAAALWQHFVAAKSNSCALTLADRIISFLGLDQRWPDVFEVRASCADAAVKVLGVPFEFWGLALFALVGVMALNVAISKSRRTRY